MAVTDASAVKSILHVLVPLHAPDHPANTDPEFAVAVSFIAVPVLKPAMHVEPQLIPAGLLVTVPPPVPFVTTVNW